MPLLGTYHDLLPLLGVGFILNLFHWALFCAVVLLSWKMLCPGQVLGCKLLINIHFNDFKGREKHREKPFKSLART